jgi:hypothetical protein
MDEVVVVHVAIITIVTEVVKRAGFPNRFLPILALAIGMTLGYIVGELPGVLQGILWAGASMGLYRGSKVVIKGR